MYQLEEYYLARSAEDALAKLKENPDNVLLGGAAYLRMWSNKRFHCGIDLSRSGLNYYRPIEDGIELGAALSLRQFETDPRLKSLAFGLFPQASAQIVGIQLRREVQLGASLCSKFAYSDVIPCLLALDAKLDWLEAGEENIVDFLSAKSRTDLLRSIRIENLSQIQAAAFGSIRYNSGDLPSLNMAASYRQEAGLALAMGAMPARARRLSEVEAAFEGASLEELSDPERLHAAHTALDHYKYGSDSRASAEYRRAMSHSLLDRIIADLKRCPSLHVEVEVQASPEIPEGTRGLRLEDGSFIPSNAELDQPFFFYLDGRRVDAQISADESLFSLLRRLRKYSVKSGCSSSCCGLCTVLVEGEARLSCSIPAHRIHGLEVRTLEGERDEASRFARLLAAEGGEQCGFCSPGFILSVVALKRQQPNANDSEIKARLSGNLCRCTGYQSQMRAIRHYLDMKE